MQRVVLRHAGAVEDEEVPGGAQQAQAHDQQAGDGAAAEGDVQRRLQAGAGGLGGAHVGANRDEHADVAGQAGKHRADREADRRRPIEAETDHHEQHDAHHADGGILPVHVGLRALLYGGGNALHLLVAGGFRKHPARGQQAIYDRQRGSAHGQPKRQLITHQSLLGTA